VKITGVISPVYEWQDFGSAKVTYGSASGHGGMHPFEPFTLSKHGLMEMILTIPMHCNVGPDQSVEISQVQVSTSFFGMSHTVEVPVEPFAITFATAC
jgi:hypothetical protein